MIYLDRNEFNFPPSPKVTATIKNLSVDNLCFYTRIYDEGKKSVVSVRLSELFNLPENQVILGYGGEDILKNAIHYYLSKSRNKTLLIPSYSWWYYSRIANECAGKTEYFKMDETEDSFQYNIDALILQTCELHPTILLLASPNNPTGNILSVQQLNRIMEAIPKDVMVLIDEAYAAFVHNDTRYVSELINRWPNLIIVRSFSKFYGLPGLRMGFGFIGTGHDDFLSYTNKYLGYNRFSEKIALAALDSQDYYREVAAEMQKGRELFRYKLGHLAGFKIYDSSANFILIKYPVKTRQSLQKALNEAGIKVKFLEDAGLESCMRITLGPLPIIEKIVNIISDISTTL